MTVISIGLMVIDCITLSIVVLPCARLLPVMIDRGKKAKETYKELKALSSRCKYKTTGNVIYKKKKDKKYIRFNCKDKEYEVEVGDEYSCSKLYKIRVNENNPNEVVIRYWKQLYRAWNDRISYAGGIPVLLGLMVLAYYGVRYHYY